MIEVKQPTAKYTHVDQLQRCVSYFRESIDSHVRGILVAPSIHTTVERLLRDQNLEWVKFEEYQRISTSPGQSSIDDWRD
ncbi:endonuclease NucS domain-containing protein [Halorubrum californiense]|uniref:endonuclease NucS domain-containing protein n=1 Tax=Halorubrum californiense TaxID=416585 RepID=UPI0009B5A7A9